MFYVAEAFLEGEEKAFSKHSAVIAAFGRDFARTGKVPREFHRFLLDAYEVRWKGDYGRPPGISAEEARQQIQRASQFLSVAEQLIGPIPQGG